MCSGRVDLEFMLRAFANGQDGVLVGGCKLDECNYITHGNYDALANVYLCRKILERIGLYPERLRIAFMSGADGHLLVQTSNEFAEQVRAMGPLGRAEGIEPAALQRKLAAARKLVPFLRLAERERLRVPVKSKAAYSAFFESDETDRMFDAIFTDKWATSQILLLLRDAPLSTRAIAEKLGLNPSEVSRHINSSSRYGLVRYDTASNCYALA